MKYLYAAIAAIVLAWLGPALDAIDEQRASLAAKQQAEQDAQKQARLTKALRALCGENGVAVEQADGAYRCYTKREFRTEVISKVEL